MPILTRDSDMNNTSTFNHPLFGDVRTVEQNNDVWFVAKDVAV
ncbi:hypothetical protein [Endozoicomonas sp. ONNA2]|nr:hypothetical protein [Endozoicomonas sp. ONNA2]